MRLRDRISRFPDRHPLWTPVLLMVLVAGPGYLRIEQILDEQHNIITQACEDRRDQKIILRQLVELSDDGGGRLDLTSFPSFQELDPATQQWVRDLEDAANQSPRPSQFVENALALLDVPQCSNEDP